jgi:hypothetical protein
LLTFSLFPLLFHKLNQIHGRGLYVKPLFKALNDVDHAFAVDVYAKNRARFHSVIRNMFDSLLLK